MIFSANWKIRGSKVLVICPPPVGLPVMVDTGTDPPTPAVAVVVPCDPLMLPGKIEVGVVEDVVDLGAELDLQAFSSGVSNFLFKSRSVS